MTPALDSVVGIKNLQSPHETCCLQFRATDMEYCAVFFLEQSSIHWYVYLTYPESGKFIAKVWCVTRARMITKRIWRGCVIIFTAHVSFLTKRKKRLKFCCDVFYFQRRNIIIFFDMFTVLFSPRLYLFASLGDLVFVFLCLGFFFLFCPCWRRCPRNNTKKSRVTRY